MSIRKERFCDFTREEKPGSLGIPKPAEPCTNRAISTCFFCRRDYCSEHQKSWGNVTLELTGFKENVSKVLPCCNDCLKDRLPYNPDVLVLKRFERLWSAIKRNIRAEKKAKRAVAEAAREKQQARAAAKAEKEQKAKEAVAKLEPEAEVTEAVAVTVGEVNKEMAITKEQIDEVVSTLSPREQRVLQLRFGLEDGQSRTLEEVGEEFHVGRERIRQIEAKALRKLRHPSRSRQLKDYLEDGKPHDQRTPVDKLLRAIFGR